MERHRNCCTWYQTFNIYCCILEYLLPEGEEALSNVAESAIASILVKDPSKRPKAEGLSIFDMLML